MAMLPALNAPAFRASLSSSCSNAAGQHWNIQALTTTRTIGLYWSQSSHAEASNTLPQLRSLMTPRKLNYC